MHGAPLGEIAGQGTPLAARAQQVQHCAEHLVQVYGSGLGFAPHRLKQGRDLQELVAGEVTGVLFTAHPGIVGQNY